MRSLPVLAELPPGYTVRSDAREVLVVREDLEDELAAAGLRLGSTEEFRPSDVSGRVPLRELTTPSGAFLVRRFTHGGLLRWLTGERFRDAERPFRELVLSAELRRRSVPTPEVVAARARRVGLYFRLEVVTARIDARDLGHELGRALRGELSRADRGALASSLGDLVRRMHAAGFLHPDLTPNNVLRLNDPAAGESAASTDAPRLVVLDLDGGRFTERPTDEERRTNLRRLHRFVERRSEGAPDPIRRADQRRFCAGYDPTGSRWRADWRAVSDAHARSRAVHRGGWWLERVFGRRVDPRFRSVGSGSARRP